jgi:hypothetical protein
MICVESTDRRPTDYFHFGLMFFGLIIGIAGVITTTAAAAICGVLMLLLGVAYFLLED